MSAGSSSLELKNADVTKFLACSTHLGATNLDYQMEQYVFKRRVDGVHIINLKKTYEKLLLAARAIVAVGNPTEVCVISGRQYAQRAILKFAAHTGSTPVAGRFTPGTFTNQIQAAFKEPRLLIVSDPRVDHQALTEASYVNIPVIAFCNTDSPLRYVDIAIPCNNKAPHSVGLMWWMLAREVLRLRGSISREIPWDVMVDLYLWRDQELDKEPEEVQEAPEKAGIITEVTKTTDFTEAWTDQVSVIQLATEASVEPVAAGAISSPLTKLPDDWSLGGTTDEWSAKPSGIEDWGATATDQW